MAKTLGLDLGTNSVGWAVVEKNRINNNEFKTTLKDKGVVIFSEGVKKEKGSEKSRAAERTNFRSARRIKFRRKLRKYKTLKVLINDGMCPLTIDELEKWRLYKNPETTKNESFKNYPTNSDFLDWLKTDEENNKNPYYFRDKFSRQKYDWENNKTLKEELGRAFYHIAQRRGFLSNRLEQSDDSVIEEYKEKIEEILEKVNNSAELLDNINQLFEPFEFEEKKEKDLDATEKKLNRTKKYILRVIENKIKDKNFSSFSEKKEAIHEYINKSENLSPVKGGIKTLSNEIEDANCITLGQYFYHLYKKDRNNQKNKIRTNYTAREEHYLHELEIICKTQELERIKKNEKSPDKKYFGLVKELYNAIFYQRPLKSQKGLVGNCSFEKNKPRCPVSHPLFEEFRMWSFINNIKIKTPDDDKLRVLTKEEKEKIIPKFYRKSKAHFDFEDLVKDLIPKGKKAEYYKSQDAKNVRYLINYNLNTTVSGCPTSANLKNIFGDDWKNISFNYKTVNKKEEIKSRNVNYHDLWNILSTFTTNDKLKDFALEKLKLNEKDAVKFSKISLKKDYASLSLAVIKKILPYLESKQGLIYSHAVFMANAEKVVDENIWKNETKRNELQNAIKQVIENNTLDNQITQVINGLIKNCKNSDNNFTYNEQSKDSYKDDVKNALQNFYGKKSWKELENNNKILENSCEIFFKQLKKKSGTGDFIKSKRTDEKVIDLLLGKNETGEIYCSDETRIDKLYHPSDIERFKSITIKDESGNKFKGLGSPATSSVRNPMAMRSLFQLRKLINNLILEGKIDQDTKINIELARNLNDANKRAAIKKYQEERKKIREFYKERIQEMYSDKTKQQIEPTDDDILKFQFWLEQDTIHLPPVTEQEVLKYQLWDEQHHRCIYTGKTIGITDFIGSNPIFDIEHTIPRSVSYDNSQINKTLCYNKYNRDEKINKLPIDCVNYESGKSITFKDGETVNCPAIAYGIVERWERKFKELDDKIAQLVKNTKHASTKEKKDKIIQNRHYFKMHRDYWKGKYERFTMKDVPQGFKNSQKIDIGIISKYAREYLSSVFKNKNGKSNVYSVKGEMTAEFRKAWGLQESFINEFGKKDYKPKDRSNHIHHCIDAITIACMDKNKYDTLAHAWALEEKREYNNAKKELENSKPWKTFKTDVEKIVDEVFIVHHTPDNVKKQSKKKLRKRGKIVSNAIYKKDNNEKYILNEKGKKIIEKYIYEKDKQGNKIPVFGKLLNEQEIKNKIKDTDYFILQTTEENKYYEFVKYKKDKNGNKKGEIVYKKAAIIQQGDTVRGSLHKDTFYGIIARNKSGIIKKDKEGKIKPQYVIRKTLLQTSLNPLKESDIKNIVDKEVQTKIEDAIKIEGSFKEAMNNSIWMNEEKQILIKKVRCYQSVKGAFELKPHRDLSEHKHKHQYVVANDDNYILALYEGLDTKNKKIRTFEVLNNKKSGEYYKLSNKDFSKQYPIVEEIKKGLMLKAELKKGTMVMFYKENQNEIWELDIKDRNKRLYEIRGFRADDGRITFRFHLEARPDKELKSVSKFNFNKPEAKLIISPSNFNFLIENIDFKITPTGKITKIKKQ